MARDGVLRVTGMEPGTRSCTLKKSIFALFSAVAVLAGCSTAGPYVTNISSDGRNGLNIEKCSVQMNAFMGTVTNINCISQNVQLSRSN